MEIKSGIENNKFIVQCPLNYLVIDKFHRLNGKFDCLYKTWEFDPAASSYVKAVLKKYFGVENGKYESCNLHVKNFSKEVTLGPIKIAGFPIFRATGKRTGAMICNNILLLDGEIRSGGSNNYWETIAEDTEFVILHFPKKMLNLRSIKDLGEDVTIEELDEDVTIEEEE